MEANTVTKAATALLHAKVTRTPCDLLGAELRPTTVTHAYDVQDAVFEGMAGHSSAEIAWVLKGGLTTQGAQDNFGLTEQVAGRIPMAGAHADGDELAATLFCQSPFLECEFALRVGADGQADAVAIAIEVAAFCYAPGSAMTGLDIIAENVGAAGVVLGEPQSLEAAGDLTACTADLSVNGEHVASGSGDGIMHGPLGSYAWVVAHEKARGRTPAVGTWVITGSATGITPIAFGDSFTADFGPLGTLSASVGR